MHEAPPALPPRMARLKRDKHGRPVPWFVAWIDGEPDFRVVGPGRLGDALRFRCCWLCGGTLGAHGAFVIGPMCALNRISAEPPSHRDCALYAAQACPFLTTPSMRRRESSLPAGTAEPDGVMIRRNPGVALVWISRSWRRTDGLFLFDVGDPLEVLWFAEGRAATRAEVMASIDSGMPALRERAEADPRPRAAVAQLQAQFARALELVPADTAEARG